MGMTNSSSRSSSAVTPCRRARASRLASMRPSIFRCAIFLVSYVKARGRRPDSLAAMFERRKQAQRTRITSHGEASQHFVTFLDNHDNHDFRSCPISPPGTSTFDAQYSLALSSFPDGVLAFSRILNDREVLVAVNPHTSQPAVVHAIVDGALTSEGHARSVLYSNQTDVTPPGPAVVRGGNVTVFEVDGGVSRGGPLTTVQLRLKPMEIQILG
jgi:hypothetical protein